MYYRITQYVVQLLPFLVVVCYLSLYSCANIVAPLGGPRDTRPPGIDSSKTSPNFQTNFKKQRIEIAFDEWVKLEDEYNQVVVSPPLQEQPTIKLRGRTLSFDFAEKEVLRPDATYTINFGNAIKDLSESNPTTDLRFVFATGAALDSLSCSARVTDVKTNEAIENVFIMLYDNLADSVVRTERPFYFAKTDKTGNATIRNVRSGTFKMVALLDGNANYLYDSDAEKIGFPIGNVDIRPNSNRNLRVNLFQGLPKPRVLDQELKQYGQAKVTFNQSIHNLQVRTSDDSGKFYYENQQDSLLVWYEKPDVKNWEIYLSADTLVLDTIRIETPIKADWLAKNKLVSRGIAPKSVKRTANIIAQQHPLEDFIIQWNHPISSFDTSKIQLLEDTLQTQVYPSIFIDSADYKKVHVRFAWKEEKPYTLTLLPQAVSDWYGLQNDTTTQAIQVVPFKNLGAIKLTLSNLDSAKHYVVQLLFNDKVVTERILQEQRTYTESFNALVIGQYALRIIEDTNKNARWDTGDYDLHRQPEKIMLKKLDQLRANWEIEADIDLEAL